MFGRLGLLAAVALTTMFCCSCGTVRETLPARSATEQLMISTAADRAIAKLPADVVEGKNVFIEVKNLDGYDKPYVIERLRKEVSDKKGLLAPAADKADVVFEVASGALSVDKVNFLFGMPELPLPIPSAETFKIPEIPIIKRMKYHSHAKILITVIDPKTNKSIVALDPFYGKVKDVYWWFFFIGPFRFTDLPYQVR